MLCLADRNFLGYQLLQQARSTGADLLWRAKQSSPFDALETYEDGYYLSYLFSHPEVRRRGKAGQEVPVIDYQLKGPSRRDVLSASHIDFGSTTSSGRSTGAFAWSALGTENALDELKTHLRGPQVVLRSKTPDLVLQEFYGLLLSHFCVCSLMHEAAHSARDDPDRFSFIHCVQTTYII